MCSARSLLDLAFYAPLVPEIPPSWMYALLLWGSRLWSFWESERLRKQSISLQKAGGVNSLGPHGELGNAKGGFS